VPLSSTINALLFASIGIIVFAVAFIIIAKALPGDLWRQALIEKKLQAAIILAGIAIALGWIVAAAVH
jgi:putative membrane protein